MQPQWENHAKDLNAERPNEFHSVCGMHHIPFMKLCSPIDPLVCAKPNLCSESGATTTQVPLHCCVCWLSGGNHNCIHLLAACSIATFCIHAHRSIKAINESFHLHFPTTPKEIEQAAMGSQSISPHSQIIGGCVAALDGLLIEVKVSQKKRLSM